MKNSPACISALVQAGINFDDAKALRRISMTLHTWYETECNGVIQRDGDDGEGKPFWYSDITGNKIGPAVDRERGALKRLDAIMSRYPTLTPYIQPDPRGCALYVLREGDVPTGADPSAYYNRGIAVYK